MIGRGPASFDIRNIFRKPVSVAADGVTPVHSVSGYPLLVSAVEFNKLVGQINEQKKLLQMLSVRARNFPNFPIGYHIPEVFAAVGETPPEPTYEAEQVGEYICPVRTVADLVNNLKLMDQTLPIYGAQYIEHLGKSRCIATPPTVSRERIKDSRWIGEGDTLNAAVIWTRAEQPPQPAAQEQTSAVPVVETPEQHDFRLACEEVGWEDHGTDLTNTPPSAVPVVEQLVEALDGLTKTPNDDSPESVAHCILFSGKAIRAIAAGQKFIKENGK